MDKKVLHTADSLERLGKWLPDQKCSCCPFTGRFVFSTFPMESGREKWIDPRLAGDWGVSATSPQTSPWSTKIKGRNFWFKSSAFIFPENDLIHTFTCMLVHTYACSHSLACSPVRTHPDASLHSLTRLPPAHSLIHRLLLRLTPMLIYARLHSFGHTAVPPCTHLCFPPNLWDFSCLNN